MEPVSSWLSQRFARWELDLIHGATGIDIDIDIEHRGVPMVENAWCGVSPLTHDDNVRAAHRAHPHAGAELAIANTSVSSQHLLALACHEKDFEAINRTAVELAIAA
jgi:methionine synthase I (cobalamin-dependent)